MNQMTENKISINPLWRKDRMPFDYGSEPSAYETLYFYDQPLMWVAKYRSNNWYLGQILADGGTKEACWRFDMFVYITPERIALIKENKLEVRSAFIDGGETWSPKCAWLAISGHQQSNLLFSDSNKYLWAHTVWRATPDQLFDEHLPDAGTFLSYYSSATVETTIAAAKYASYKAQHYSGRWWNQWWNQRYIAALAEKGFKIIPWPRSEEDIAPKGSIYAPWPTSENSAWERESIIVPLSYKEKSK
jgi:hypothetical protein